MIKFDKFFNLLNSIHEVEIDGVMTKLTQSKLSELTDINETVFCFMRGGEGKRKGKISMDTIERLCDFFDCQPCDLMEYVSE